MEENSNQVIYVNKVDDERRLRVCIRFVKSKQKPIIETVLIGN